MAELFAPRTLDEKGRCCGRKPHQYKTYKGAGGAKDPHLCCLRCSAEYTPDGKQRANWMWLAVDGGFTPKYAEGEHIDLARRAALRSPADTEETQR